MNILQVREYKDKHTDGDLFVDGARKRWCYTLEDPARPVNVKIPGNTCIPEGHYRVEVSVSTRFKKKMILLFNMDDRSIERNGIRFTGVRVHGVTKVEDTAGCVGAMYGSNGEGTAWHRASDDLCDFVEEAILTGEEVTWTITS